MDTASIGSGVVVKATGITVAFGVKDGWVGMGGRERGKREGSGGNSPVVTCGEKREEILIIDTFNLFYLQVQLIFYPFTLFYPLSARNSLQN